ncbi:hypothetical protein MSHOH_2535 [Methanosarcina horonobensis HB-1 = JCM 15518]|uniref:Uncharacterized protein n=1 Tax=Methanosarcina horonobensis HB-1 = JCM 15518 TaxID=1434110 RepID=A0A0E3SH52_9EURY|nr:hypothetical protein [Methanosarcina horonobensis]AKB79018.1 hypothetical protein MSHOH_2535 [Methanosarcina horonobensis HB-1 = JCM 15518]
METQNKLKTSPFTISKLAEGATYLTSDLASADEWKDLLKYSVPLGMAVEITPINYVFGEFYTTAGTTSGNIITGGMSRILKQNANGTESREIWSGSNKIFGELGDELKRPKLRVPVVVNASQKIVVQIYGLGATLDVSTSNFYIEATQYYEDI